MKQNMCPNCGADEYIYKDGFKVCRYCNSRYSLGEESPARKSAEVALSDDITRLLEKCKTDPKNAKKYAGLILDIDPTNREAKKYF